LNPNLGEKKANVKRKLRRMWLVRIRIFTPCDLDPPRLQRMHARSCTQFTKRFFRAQAPGFEESRAFISFITQALTFAMALSPSAQRPVWYSFCIGSGGRTQSAWARPRVQIREDWAEPDEL